MTQQQISRSRIKLIVSKFGLLTFWDLSSILPKISYIGPFMKTGAKKLVQVWPIHEWKHHFKEFELGGTITPSEEKG